MRGRYYNGVKTALLLTLLIAVVLVVGNLLSGRIGLIMALALSLVAHAGIYLRPDQSALRTVGARPLRPEEAPALHAMVRELADAASQPMPRLYLSSVLLPNAFTTGRSPKHAAVVVTEGILRLLTLQELRAALAHELSHVYNRDILTLSIASALAGMLTAIANLTLFTPLGESSNPLASVPMLILGPVAATLIRLAISRNREYQADADGATLSHDPIGLANALNKIEYAVRRTFLPTKAHLLITNHGLAALFHTHPPTPSRIRRLHHMARYRTRQSGGMDYRFRHR